MAEMKIKNPFARFMNEHDNKAPTLPTMEFTIETKVEERLLKKALEKALAVYPLMGMSIVKEGEDFFFVPNERPVVITNSHMPVRPGTEEANGHSFAVSYTGCDMAFSVLHSMTDGGGFLLFLKTVLYFYFCLRDDREYEPGPVRTTGDPKETYGCYFDLDFDGVLPGKKYPDSPVPEGFGVPGKDGFCFARVSVATEDFLERTRELHTSASVFMYLIFSKAVFAMYPAYNGDVALTMTVDARRVFGLPWATLNNSLFAYLYTKREDLEGGAYLDTALRLKHELKEDLLPENMMRTAGDVVLRGIGDFVHTTAKMAYLGHFDMGEATPFVKDMRMPEDSVHKMNVVDVDGRMNIGLMFGAASDGLAEAIAAEFGKMGMAAETEKSRPVLPNMDQLLTRLGYSDRYFYYRSGEVSDYDCRITVSLTDEADRGILQHAADGAMRNVPGFAVRPVQYAGSIYYEKNHLPVTIFDDDDTTRYFGTDDMNGYLICLLVKGREVTFSYSHALTDFAGIMDYIRSVICLYAEEKKGNKPSEEASVLSQLPEKCVHDPYGLFADGTVFSTWQYEEDKVFKIPDAGKKGGRERGMRITFPVSFVKEGVKNAQTSFLPYLTELAAGAVRKAYDIGDETIVVRSTADLRHVFDIHTLENCSDSFLLPCLADEGAGIKERCAYLRSGMKKQLNRDNYFRLMAKKAAAVEVYENERTDNPYADAKERKITFSLIYTGNMTMPEECGSTVENFYLEMCADYAEGLIVVCHTCGEHMTLDILEKNSAFPVAGAIREMLMGEGLAPDVKTIYEHGCNLLSRNHLKRMG